MTLTGAACKLVRMKGRFAEFADRTVLEVPECVHWVSLSNGGWRFSFDEDRGDRSGWDLARGDPYLFVLAAFEDMQR